MSVEWIEYQGQRILFIDASNLANDYTMLLERDLASLITLLQAEQKNSVLALADLRKTVLNNNVLMAILRNAPLAAPYFRKSALVIEPSFPRRIILDSLGQFIEQLPKRFDKLEDAKAWLVSNDK